MADRSSSKTAEKAEDNAPPVIEYTALTIYKDLLLEQQGKAPTDEDSL